MAKNNDVIYQLVADLVCNTSEAQKGLQGLLGVLTQVEQKFSALDKGLKSAFQLGNLESSMNKLNASLERAEKAREASLKRAEDARAKREQDRADKKTKQEQERQANMLSSYTAPKGLKNKLKAEDALLDKAIEKRTRGETALNNLLSSLDSKMNPTKGIASYSTDAMKVEKNKGSSRLRYIMDNDVAKNLKVDKAVDGLVASIQKGADQWDKNLNKMKNSTDRNIDSINKKLKTTKIGFSDLLDSMFNLRNTLMAVVGSEIVGDLVQTTNQIQGIRATFTALTNSSKQAGQEMDWVMNKANELGQVSLDTAQSYAKFMAASQDKFDTSTMHDIYTSLMQASTVLHLQPHEFKLVSLAIEQMASKGKISTEELRRQLGEHLPGAVHLAAKALGVTEAKLNKMLKDGAISADKFLPLFAKAIKEKYIGGLEMASKSTQSEINRMINSWNELKIKMADSGFIAGLSKFATAMSQMLQSKPLMAFANGLGKLSSVLADNLESIMIILGVIFGRKLLGNIKNLAMIDNIAKRFKLFGAIIGGRSFGVAGIANLSKFGKILFGVRALFGGWIGIALMALPLIIGFFKNLYKHSVGFRNLCALLGQIFSDLWGLVVNIGKSIYDFFNFGKDNSPFNKWVEDLEWVNETLTWLYQKYLQMTHKDNVIDAGRSLGFSDEESVRKLVKHQMKSLNAVKAPQVDKIEINNNIQGTSDPVKTGQIASKATVSSFKREVLPDFQLANLDLSRGY